MPSAQDITIALGGRWHGSYGMAPCPAHDDGHEPALKVSDHSDTADDIIVHCFAGCSWQDVKAELRRRKLLPEWEPEDRAGATQSSGDRVRRPRQSAPAPAPARNENDNPNRGAALKIWREATLAVGTHAEAYLRTRGVEICSPPSLRFHPSLEHRPTGLRFGALVAGVQDPDGHLQAIHRTWLLPSGRGKAGVSSPKMALGSLGRGALRLAKADTTLGLAEGIETGLSASQLFEVPVWCALGLRLDAVELPREVRHVVLFGDNGEAGHDAVHRAATVFMGEGRKVTVCLPPDGLGDWNDALRAREEAA